MHGRVFLLGLIIYCFFLVCVTRSSSTFTTPPETAATQNDLNVTGYLNFFGLTTLRILLENVSWYDARVICGQEGFGRLDDATKYHMRTSMVTEALREANMYNVSLWTSNFRPNGSSDEWWWVDKNGQCKTKSLEFDSQDVGENQCATNRYRGQGDVPLLEYQACSSHFRFVCTDWKADGSNFTKYAGYDFGMDPPNSTVNTNVYGFENCLSVCGDTGLCVGFSHNATSNECRFVRANFGFQRLHYTIEYYGSTVSHYTKTGTNVTFVEVTGESISIDASQTFECSHTPTNTMTSLMPSTTFTMTTQDLEATQEVVVLTTQIYETIVSTLYITSTIELIYPTTVASTTATSITPDNTTPLTTQGSTSQTPTISEQSTLSTTSSNFTPTLSTPTEDDDTMCVCGTISCKNSTFLNETQMEELVDILVRNLTVAKKETFKFKSTLVCSKDNRTSSRTMGVVASLVMGFVFGPIVISDISQLIRYRSV